MEQSGGNEPQSAADALAPKTAQTSRNRCPRLPLTGWRAITDETIDARVWEGVHFRFSDDVGAQLWRDVVAAARIYDGVTPPAVSDSNRLVDR